MSNVATYPNTAQQFSPVQSFMEKAKVRSVVQKEKKNDDTLFTKEAYYAMLDERIASAERGNVRRLTPEVEKELFGSVL